MDYYGLSAESVRNDSNYRRQRNNRQQMSLGPQMRLNGPINYQRNFIDPYGSRGMHQPQFAQGIDDLGRNDEVRMTCGSKIAMIIIILLMVITLTACILFRSSMQTEFIPDCNADGSVNYDSQQQQLVLARTSLPLLSMVFFAISFSLHQNINKNQCAVCLFFTTLAYIISFIVVGISWYSQQTKLLESLDLCRLQEYLSSDSASISISQQDMDNYHKLISVNEKLFLWEQLSRILFLACMLYFMVVAIQLVLSIDNDQQDDQMSQSSNNLQEPLLDDSVRQQQENGLQTQELQELKVIDYDQVKDAFEACYSSSDDENQLSQTQRNDIDQASLFMIQSGEQLKQETVSYSVSPKNDEKVFNFDEDLFDNSLKSPNTQNSESFYLQQSCAICHVQYTKGSKINVMPKCTHTFHQDCINMWLQIKATCPLCNTNVRDALNS